MGRCTKGPIAHTIHKQKTHCTRYATRHTHLRTHTHTHTHAHTSQHNCRSLCSSAFLGLVSFGLVWYSWSLQTGPVRCSLCCSNAPPPPADVRMSSVRQCLSAKNSGAEALNTHNENRKNKNRARKAVKENSSGAAGQPWTSFGLLTNAVMCSAGFGYSSSLDPCPAPETVLHYQQTIIHLRRRSCLNLQIMQPVLGAST